MGRSLWQELGGQRERFGLLEQEVAEVQDNKRLQVVAKARLEVDGMVLQEVQRLELELKLR